MARIFEFQKHSCEVDVAGCKFELDCSSYMGETMKALSVEFSQLVMEINSGKKNTDDALTLYCRSIDRILGDGAADKIFDGRERELDDAVDVIFFLMDTVKAYNKRRTQDHMTTSKPGKHHGKKRKN